MDEQEASRHFELGCECRRQARNREAVSHFRHVVRIDPGNYPAWNNMGNAQDDLGDSDAAIESWRMAVKVKSDYDVALHNLGRALLRKSEFKTRPVMLEAVGFLKAAVNAKPDKQESWALLGAAYNVLGETDEAERCLTKALRLKPDDAGAQRVLNIVRKKKGESGKSEGDRAVRPRQTLPGLKEGRVYSINLNDGSGGLFKVLTVDAGTLEVLPINAAEPSRFAGGPRTILAHAVVSFEDPGPPWSSYGEGGHLEAELGTEKSSGGCFIATTVYGSDQAPEVKVLRIFRDERLLRSRVGRVAVECYYMLAPGVAVVVSACPRLARFLRLCIDVLVRQLDSLSTQSGRGRLD